jgi:hypothetical protein
MNKTAALLFACAASLASATARCADTAAPVAPAARPAKPMPEDEVMAGEMKKDGMNKGAVRKKAEMHDKKMQEMMKNEKMK